MKAPIKSVDIKQSSFSFIAELSLICYIPLIFCILARAISRLLVVGFSHRIKNLQCIVRGMGINFALSNSLQFANNSERRLPDYS